MMVILYGYWIKKKRINKKEDHSYPGDGCKPKKIKDCIGKRI